MHILTHSVINTHARTTTKDGRRCCSRWLTHYRERVTERSEEDAAAAAANGRQPVYLLRSLCTLPLPPSQSALLVHCPCVSRILTIYSYVATLARIIHGKFTKSRRKTKMKLRPIKFVHIKYKISQVTNFECPASPLLLSFLSLSL